MKPGDWVVVTEPFTTSAIDLAAGTICRLVSLPDGVVTSPVVVRTDHIGWTKSGQRCWGVRTVRPATPEELAQVQLDPTLAL